MNLLQIAAESARAVGGGWLPAAQASALAAQAGTPEDQWLLVLIEVAKTFARPGMSGFHVGAVGKGVSGAVYFGANLEFAANSLNQTVHAEQAVVVNAQAHRETELACLAVSAAPCGYCRQFLFELSSAHKLRILVPQQPPQMLLQLLPRAFGPADLGVKGGLLDQTGQRLEWADEIPDELGAAAFRAAQAAYAPYTGALAGVALLTRSGRIYAGSYLENAAFNPSIPPLQAAMVALTLGEPQNELPVEAAIVEVENSKIDHARAARGMLETFAPRLPLREFRVRPPTAPHPPTREKQ
jgi:cytidine deaminase